jgi:hypothetical protein
MRGGARQGVAGTVEAAAVTYFPFKQLLIYVGATRCCCQLKLRVDRLVGDRVAPQQWSYMYGSNLAMRGAARQGVAGQVEAAAIMIVWQCNACCCQFDEAFAVRVDRLMAVSRTLLVTSSLAFGVWNVA